MADPLWDACATALAQAGAGHVFGLTAEGDGLLEAADRHPGLVAIPARDQRGAGLMGVGYAVAGERPAILAASTGPGFANAMAALLEASSCCVPLLVVTDGVAEGKRGRGGFQEADHLAMVAKLAKWVFRVGSPDQLAWALGRGVHLAVNGRPGVAVEEIPQGLSAPAIEPALRPVPRLRTQADPDGVHAAVEALTSARRPLILAGGGARRAGAGAPLTDLATRLRAPVLTTASGRGCVDERCAQALGLCGLYATPPVDEVQRRADLLLAVGTQLEETATGGWEDFPGLDMVVQIDLEPEVFGRMQKVDVGLLGDATLVLRQILAALPTTPGDHRVDWLAEVAACKADLLRRYAPSATASSATCSVLTDIQVVYGAGLVLVQEDGLHDMWAYHYPVHTVSPPGTTIAPGEQTTLGFALPAAIGARLAGAGVDVVVLGGDGAFQMSMGSLPVAAELEIGLTVVVLNDGGFGWPRMWQRAHGVSTRTSDFGEPHDYVGIARRLGGVGTRVGPGQSLRSALTEARSAAHRGRVAVVETAVPADDIPVGVQRLYGPWLKAGSAPS